MSRPIGQFSLKATVVGFLSDSFTQNLLWEPLEQRDSKSLGWRWQAGGRAHSSEIQNFPHICPIRTITVRCWVPSHFPKQHSGRKKGLFVGQEKFLQHTLSQWSGSAVHDIYAEEDRVGNMGVSRPPLIMLGGRRAHWLIDHFLDDCQSFYT